MKPILLLLVLFLCSRNTVVCQINLAFTKKNTFKIAVFTDGTLMKTGSGFVYRGFKKDGKNICIGISNAHVLDGGDSIVIQFEDKSVSQTYFDFIDVEKDLISFQFKTDDFKQGFIPSLPINFKQGDEVFTMSNPKGLEYSLSKGEIASIRTEYGNEMIQFTAPASPGSSGSVLVNNKGQLIGIVSSQVVGGQNLNFAISLNSAQEFLNKYNTNQINISPSKEIKRIYNYKSENSSIIKELHEIIRENKSNTEIYSLLQDKKRYVLLDNYCLLKKIRIEIEDKLYQNALESFFFYNNNFGFSSQLISLQYSMLVDELPDLDKKLLLKYLEFNGSLAKQYNSEPFFLFKESLLNFKLKDYYSAISSAIKFASNKEDFDNKDSYSGISNLRTLNKFSVSTAYKIMADSYKKLQNYNLAEENYINAINNSLLIGDWCDNSLNLITYYWEMKEVKKLCALIESLEKNSNYTKCNINKLIDGIKSICQ